MTTDRQHNRSCRSAISARRVGFVFQLTLILTLSTLAASQKKGSCIECHSKLDDPRLSAPAKLFDNDIHKSRGLSCNDCHGGDPNADTKEGAKDPRKGYLGKPKTLDIPAYCGKCHSDANLMKRFNPSLRVDQEREYNTSVHAKALYEKQDPSAPTCNDCHGNHGATPPGIASVANVCGQCHARQ